jgi:uroporphyrinogen decarboxylase
MVTKRERVEAILSGGRADRLPTAFWRHWPGDDQDSGRLAEVTVAFHRRYDWDLARITPSSSYAAEDWGTRTAYTGTLPIGERIYLERPVKTARDWLAIRPQDVTQGALGRQLDTIRRVRGALGRDVPVIMTVFNPLSVARYLVGDERFWGHLRVHGNEVRAALQAITATYAGFVREALRAGSDGIFFSTAAAASSVMTESECREVGVPYDLQMPEAAAGGWLNVLHLHSAYPMMGLGREYPVHAVNWDDRASEPDLAEGKRLVEKAVFGGIHQWQTLLKQSHGETRRRGMKSMRASTRSEGVVRRHGERHGSPPGAMGSEPQNSARARISGGHAAGTGAVACAVAVGPGLVGSPGRCGLGARSPYGRPVAHDLSPSRPRGHGVRAHRGFPPPSTPAPKPS